MITQLAFLDLAAKACPPPRRGDVLRAADVRLQPGAFSSRRTSGRICTTRLGYAPLVYIVGGDDGADVAACAPGPDRPHRGATPARGRGARRGHGGALGSVSGAPGARARRRPVGAPEPAQRRDTSSSAVHVQLDPAPRWQSAGADARRESRSARGLVVRAQPNPEIALLVPQRESTRRASRPRSSPSVRTSA